MNAYDTLMQKLNNGEQLLIDGATGTELERRDVAMVKDGWNGAGSMTNPDIVRGVHEDYIRSGANIIISNTFSTSRHVLRDAGIDEHFELLNRRSVELAREARDNMQTPDVLVAGGITHWSFTKNYPSNAELRTNMEEQAQIMADAGADLIMLEMMIHIERMQIVLEAAQKTGLPVWVGMSCEVGEDGIVRLWDGETLADALTALQPYNVPLINIMHTDVIYMDACLDVVESHWSGLAGVYAHSGRFENPNWVFNDTITPEEYATAADSWLKRGINLIGGCCGVGIEHIKALKERGVYSQGS